ncbi:TolB family protein, partial [Marinilabilia sp.]
VDINSGNVFKRIPTPANKYPLHPEWTDQPGKLVLVLLGHKGKEIVLLDTHKGTWKQVRKPAFDEPRYPSLHNQMLWFTASTPHSEEIFRKNLQSGKTFRVTQSRYGATSPVVDPQNKKVYYSNYTARGYQLVSTDLNQQFESNVSPANLSNSLVKTLTEQEPEVAKPSKQQSFKSEPYSKWNLFNLHSWAPAYIDIDETLVAPGISLMSQNLLGTAISRVGFNANRSETREKFNVGFTYRGWFPIIDFDVKWGDFSETFDGYYSDSNEIFTIKQLEKEKQIKLESGVRVPLDISIGKWRRFLQPRVKLSWQNNSNRMYEKTIWGQNPDGTVFQTGEKETIQIPDLDYWGMEYSLYFHNKLRGTSRDVNTRWGQTISLIYRHTPWGNYNSGNAYAISSRMHFPGVGKHHALVLDNGWQKKTNGDQFESDLPYKVFQKFGDLISLPRGYSFIRNDDMYLFRGTYQMPLWNPDLSIGGLAYIKRFRLNAFFDATLANYQLDYIEEGGKEDFSNTFTSSGIELMADFHALRFVLPFSVGYRGGFRDADNTFFHEAVFSTSFNSFLINQKN